MRAIDIHVHPGTAAYHATHGDTTAGIERFFKHSVPVYTEDELAAYFVEREIRAVLLAFDAETETGFPATSNDYVAEVVHRYEDAFVGGFASVDPWKGRQAVQEVERAVGQLGLIGVKFHPSVQGFYANEARFMPLWEKCAELDVPVLFHTGITGWPGVRLDHARPIPYLDDVAARLPELRMILAHPAWPWHDEQIAMALHKPNVYIDLSGWSPKYFPESLKRDIRSRLSDKVLYGSDFPAITPDRWLQDFELLELDSETRDKILFGNAQRLLRLDAEASA